MVKFGVKLANNRIEQWEAHYIDYDGLKKLMKKMKKKLAKLNQQKASSSSAAAGGGYGDDGGDAQQPEYGSIEEEDPRAPFAAACRAELRKVEAFYAEMCTEFAQRLEHLAKFFEADGASGAERAAAATFDAVETDEKDAIDAPRAQQRGVEDIWSVRRGDDNDALERMHAVELLEELAEDAVPNARPAVAGGAAPHGEGVDFIKEDDGRCGTTRFAKDLLQGLLRLSHPFREELRAFDCNEVHLTLPREGFCHQRFRAPRRAVKKKPLRGADPHANKRIGVVQRPLHRLPQPLLRLLC
jgi:hypothetical protein